MRQVLPRILMVAAAAGASFGCYDAFGKNNVWDTGIRINPKDYYHKSVFDKEEPGNIPLPPSYDLFDDMFWDVRAEEDIQFPRKNCLPALPPHGRKPAFAVFSGSKKHRSDYIDGFLDDLINMLRGRGLEASAGFQGPEPETVRISVKRVWWPEKVSAGAAVSYRAETGEALSGSIANRLKPIFGNVRTGDSDITGADISISLGFGDDYRDAVLYRKRTEILQAIVNAADETYRSGN
ncbi:MAG: hypothetical protein DRH37_11190 [Deltaproteobacteria bacterium]|nr:MAG: hypothetical protein DRH37_11190 [Deltaproteobacteria bacterium]